MWVESHGPTEVANMKKTSVAGGLHNAPSGRRIASVMADLRQEPGGRTMRHTPSDLEGFAPNPPLCGSSHDAFHGTTVEVLEREMRILRNEDYW
ncbi:hypothetical protein NDU88_004658 [Pleurodeles waltl]|uniref:Uncharacterized protein n=1 Tax=Pleurodeles waltl TaxID=8319 RepID=A0AAV7LKK9_PLEWA|nr:hypothetical protein NDU88_004658 [Pleurodeles waltl]